MHHVIFSHFIFEQFKAEKFEFYHNISHRFKVKFDREIVRLLQSANIAPAPDAAELLIKKETWRYSSEIYALSSLARRARSRHRRRLRRGHLLSLAHVFRGTKEHNNFFFRAPCPQRLQTSYFTWGTRGEKMEGWSLAGNKAPTNQQPDIRAPPNHPEPEKPPQGEPLHVCSRTKNVDLEQ